MPDPITGRSVQEFDLLRALGNAEGVRIKAASGAEGFVSAIPIREFVSGIADETEDEALAQELTDFIVGSVGDDFIKASRLHARALGQRPLSSSALADILDESLAQGETDAARIFRIEFDRLRGRFAAVEESGAVDAIAAMMKGPTHDALIAPFGKAARRTVLGSISRAFDMARVATRETREDAATKEDRALLWTWLTVGDKRVCETGAMETSCHPRHGIVKRMSDWEKIGLPQAPNLRCAMFSPEGTSYCRCDLVEASRFDVPLKPFDATEALNLARKPYSGKRVTTVLKPMDGIERPIQSYSDQDTLLRLAKEELPRVEKTLKELDLDGVSYHGARIKDFEKGGRGLEKLQKKGAQDISDYLGSRVFYDNPADVQKVMDKMREAGYRVNRFEDFTTGPDTRWGYRAIHTDFYAPNGLSFELQIIPKEVGEIKDVWWPTFAKWRNVDELPTPLLQLHRRQALERMRDAFTKQINLFWERVGGTPP
jgi:catechol 2,3-dioxygenase-like lactoylglutathione lyase family enzyme